MMMEKQLVVTVGTQAVITALVTNCDAHLVAHSKLLLAWAKTMRHLSGRLAANVEKKLPDFQAIRFVVGRLSKVEASRPALMVDRYQEVIRMLEAHLTQQNTIELTRDQFQAYMEDKWDWKESWVYTSNTYMSDEE
jgi:hypothetical protein